jgi:hypothetical protein
VTRLQSIKGCVADRVQLSQQGVRRQIEPAGEPEENPARIFHFLKYGTALVDESDSQGHRNDSLSSNVVVERPRAAVSKGSNSRA